MIFGFVGFSEKLLRHRTINKENKKKKQKKNINMIFVPELFYLIH